MALGFKQVSDWISWENEGANVAVADLDNDDLLELIVLRVDHPTPGPNRGFYRVGQGLDANGNIPGCPAGGTYSITTVGDNPICSLASKGHKLP